jgi:hypothetical protein
VKSATITAKGSGLVLGPQRPLFSGKTIPQLLGDVRTSIHMDATRDGKRLLLTLPITEHTDSPSLNLVSNWTEELKK